MLKLLLQDNKPIRLFETPRSLSEYVQIIRPVALSGYRAIAHEVKPNGLLIRGP